MKASVGFLVFVLVFSALPLREADARHDRARYTRGDTEQSWRRGRRVLVQSETDGERPRRGSHRPRNRSSRDDARSGGDSQDEISSGRAAAIARAATGGRVLEIRPGRGGRSEYRVKMLLDGGRVRTVTVDARSGEVRR